MDLFLLQLALIASYSIRHGLRLVYFAADYRPIALLLVLAQLCVVFVQRSYHGIIRRGPLAELLHVVRYVTYIIFISFAYMFIGKSSETFSRMTFLLTWGIGIVLIYLGHLLLRKIVRARLEKKAIRRSILVVCEQDKAEALLQTCTTDQYTAFSVCGVIVTDRALIGETICGVPVVGYGDIPRDFATQTVIDEVLMHYDEESPHIRDIRRSCMEMGLPIHKIIADTMTDSDHMLVEKFAGYTVLTTSINMATPRQLFLKRLIDIFGGFIGLLFTALLTIFIGPIIFIKSPGPVFFSQERMGKNGRRFRIYKFRSMYMDAEERKRELMDQNEMQGLMFKIENDPRIIKGIGHFIRNTSIDEFPQFWNVLKGDMSLVGTRPPTVEEYEQYELHHRVRLATKPGITGMWQVSGRSEITDFEEVVALDMQYIRDWSLALDFKILCKTVLVVLRHEGAK